MCIWRPLALVLLLAVGNAHEQPSGVGGTGDEHLKSYLLLDSRNVQDNGGTRLVLGPVRKHGKPVLTEEEKWVGTATRFSSSWLCNWLTSPPTMNLRGCARSRTCRR